MLDDILLKRDKGRFGVEEPDSGLNMVNVAGDSAYLSRFGIPARTLEGWEQGRAIDATARVLLSVIEKEPGAVERALA